MSLDSISGRVYGPVRTRIAAEKVAEYVAATGDDPVRWEQVAPPSYAGALLFAVAPLLISDSDVGAATRVLVHTDQRFVWHGPLVVDTPVEVTGTVTRVRERGDVAFTTLETTVVGDGGPLIDMTSTFLMGSEPAAPPGDDRDEPAVDHGSRRPPMSVVTDLTPGASLPPAELGASRADLVRYAGASGDLNPIHFDHDAARGAGLDGVVVHGLLMAAWLSRLAAAVTERPDPLAEMRLRFRSALFPAEVAVATGTADGDDPTRLALTLRRGDDDLVTASAVVRR
jgi:acyl dehydratase